MIIVISPPFSEHSVVVSIKSLFTLPQSLICYNLFCEKICCLCNCIHATFIRTTIKRIYFLILQKFQNNCRIFLAFFRQRSCSVFFPIVFRLCVTHEINSCHFISSISSSIFTNPYFSYNGRPISVASKAICDTPCFLTSFTSKSNV